MARHRLDPTPTTVVEVFDPSLPPALEVDPGDELTVRSLDASGHLERQTHPGQQRPGMFEPRRGHCLTGPVAVRGAGDGDVLAVELLSLTPDDWGWTVAGARDTRVTRRLGLDPEDPAWLLWELDAAGGTGRSDTGFVRTLAPFLGVVGMPPPEPGEHPTVPPRARGGGNIDCKELVAGSTLYLPVTVPGAMLCLGDGHAAQGDGEVGGTAIECGMTTDLRLGLIQDAPLDVIHADTPAGRVTFGFDADLDTAAGDALDAMVTWMQVLFDLRRAKALALASTVVDLRVTQIANETWGVHAVLPREEDR